MQVSLLCPTNSLCGVMYFIQPGSHIQGILFQSITIYKVNRKSNSTKRRQKKQQHVVRELPTMDLRRSTRIAAKVGPSTNPAGPSKPKAKDLKKKLKVPRIQQSSSVSKRGAPTKRSMAFLEAESRQGFHGFEPTSAMVRIIFKVLLLYLLL